jgi:two-component system, chemotaxis family, chemotaxis protein CheY
MAIGSPSLHMTVLVVDDNHHMRTIIRELLRSIGVTDIKEAADPVDAFELLKSVPVDLLLADLSMPIIDGVEFVQMVRNSADSPNPFLPIVMITGHSERSKVTAARDAGVNEFLVKPVTAKNLMDRLVSVVNSPRTFVRSASYFGPDRRRKTPQSYEGPWRRKDDKKE